MLVVGRVAVRRAGKALTKLPCLALPETAALSSLKELAFIVSLELGETTRRAVGECWTERVGFEPTVGGNLRWFSRPLP